MRAQIGPHKSFLLACSEGGAAFAVKATAAILPAAVGSLQFSESGRMCVALRGEKYTFDVFDSVIGRHLGGIPTDYTDLDLVSHAISDNGKLWISDNDGIVLGSAVTGRLRRILKHSSGAGSIYCNGSGDCVAYVSDDDVVTGYRYNDRTGALEPHWTYKVREVQEGAENPLLQNAIVSCCRFSTNGARAVLTSAIGAFCYDCTGKRLASKSICMLAIDAVIIDGAMAVCEPGMPDPGRNRNVKIIDFSTGQMRSKYRIPNVGELVACESSDCLLAGYCPSWNDREKGLPTVWAISLRDQRAVSYELRGGAMTNGAARDQNFVGYINWRYDSTATSAVVCSYLLDADGLSWIATARVKLRAGHLVQ